jgi:hypothetical protein
MGWILLSAAQDGGSIPGSPWGLVGMVQAFVAGSASLGPPLSFSLYPSGVSHEVLQPGMSPTGMCGRSWKGGLAGGPQR